MDCPQCGAEVPSDDAFCGKCGYAMRDQAPERVDQSRIRVHEEPAPPAEGPPGRAPSQQRIRKRTVMGMPSLGPASGASRPPPSPPAEAGPPSPPEPPTEISSARARTRARTPHKTMLGIPQADFPESADVSPADEQSEAERGSGPPVERFGPPHESASPSHRARARVRYDSGDEPFPVVQRRKNALRALAVLVLSAGAWLAYRYVTLHG